MNKGFLIILSAAAALAGCATGGQSVSSSGSSFPVPPGRIVTHPVLMPDAPAPTRTRAEVIDELRRAKADGSWQRTHETYYLVGGG